MEFTKMRFSSFPADRRSPRQAATHLPGPKQSKPLRCQAITVSGFTMTGADRQVVQNRDKHAQRYQSPAVSLDCFTERLQNVGVDTEDRAPPSEERPGQSLLNRLETLSQTVLRHQAKLA
jgi:hypothetical protein